MMENNEQETRSKLIQEYVESHAQETLELLRALAVIPAPLGQEEKRAAFVLDWLHGVGAREAYTDAAGNVIFPYAGDGRTTAASESCDRKERRTAAASESCDRKERQAAAASESCDREERQAAAASESCDRKERQAAACPDPDGARGEWTVVTAHMDVVCPDTDALPLEETEERLIGPGVRDDTANLVNMLMAIKFLLAHPELQENRILFAADVGEEGLGNLRGSREILREFDGRIRQWLSFDLNYDTIYTRAVGSRRYRVTVSTKGGHSYSDFGEANAIHRLAELIAELYQTDVSGFSEKATYNVGCVEGGTSVNSIAQEASMLFEIRSESEKVLCELQNSLYEKIEKHRAEDVQIRIEVIGVRPGNGPVDPKSQQDLERRCLQAVQLYYDGAVTCTAGSTDCNIPLSAGIPAVTVGTTLGAGTHTRREWVDKESMKTGQMIALEILLGI